VLGHQIPGAMKTINMKTIRKMAVFWIAWFALGTLQSQTKAAYLVSDQNNASIGKPQTSTNTNLIPFEKAGNLLLVKAEIDSKAGSFILDTGAPTLVINFASQRNTVHAKGITGALMVNDTFIRQFRWNNVEWKNVSGLNVDMQHFEESSNQGIQGLIGYEILKNYEVVVDPSKQTIQLLSNRKELPYEPSKVVATTYMYQQDHLPVVEVEINGKRVLLGIDTGAEVNFLDQKLLDNGTLDGGEPVGWSTINGLDQFEKREPKLRLKYLSIGGIVLQNQTFVISNLDHLFPNKEGLKIQGIIGATFLNQFRYSINYRKASFSIINFL
jgi:predicted aspartyl protease